jgi:hypothetical protein
VSIYDKSDKKRVHELLLASQVDHLLIPVSGFSMAPTLRPGDRITISKGFYLPGDILVFSQGEQLVVHRLLGWWWQGGEIRCITRGDNRDWIDSLVPGTMILGKVLFWERDGVTMRERWLWKLKNLCLNAGDHLATRCAHLFDRRSRRS